MLLNYAKLAIRLLSRNPLFTFINLLGLSVGFAAFFILWQYSQSELSSDRFHQDSERIVRFGLKVEWTDDKVYWQQNTWGTNSPLFTERVKKEYHVVESFTTLSHQNNFSLVNPEFPDHEKEIFMSVSDKTGYTRSFMETRVAYADPNFLMFFSIPLLRGNSHTALSTPESLVLSEKTALKYFGTGDPLGKTVQLNNTISLTVSGVFKDLPENTHLKFDMLISTVRVRNLIPDRGWYFHCYMKLHVGTNPETLTESINSDLGETINKVAWGGWKYGKAKVYMQPLSEVVFASYMLDPHHAKSRFVLIVMGYASVLILIMAWINHVNLTIASIKKRLTEIGARKTVGARQVDFFIQFLIEAACINIISFLIATTIMQLIRQPAETIFRLYVPPLNEIATNTLALAAIGLITSILFTGLYPPMVTLKHTPKSLVTSSKPIKQKGFVSVALTTFQLCAAMVLIIWIFAVYKQLNFILHKDIGFSKDEVVVVDLPTIRPGNFDAHVKSFGNEASLRLKNKEYTVSQSVPGDNSQSWMGLKRKVEDAGMQVECNGGVDEHFLSFFGIELLAGRNFLQDHPVDSNSVIISEGAAQRLGFADLEDAVGENIVAFGTVKAKVIGIIKDYKIRPLLYEGYMNYSGNPGLAIAYKDYLSPSALMSIPKKISFRISPEEFSEAIARIEKQYQTFFPGSIFNWRFLNDVITGHYKQQETQRNQIILFASIAIIIACLGLFGMITHKVMEKTKEVGIRKVLGARIDQIAYLLVKAIVGQAILAVIIGLPIAWYLTDEYLQNFSERIRLEWWHYSIPIGIFGLIMFATIASVLWKALKSNPVNALKYE